MDLRGADAFAPLGIIPQWSLANFLRADPRRERREISFLGEVENSPCEIVSGVFSRTREPYGSANNDKPPHIRSDYERDAFLRNGRSSLRESAAINDDHDATDDARKVMLADPKEGFLIPDASFCSFYLTRGDGVPFKN